MTTEKSQQPKSNVIAAPAGLGRKQTKKETGKQKGKKRLAGLSRWLHIYLSMVSFTILLFFAVSGLTLNHADWFTSGKEVVTKDSGAVSLKWVNQPDTTKINKLQLVEYFRNKHQVKGALSDFRIDDGECSLTFNGPGYVADAFVDRESGKYELSVTRLGAVAVINDLHKGRDSGKAWSWIIDISAVLMTLVSISGIILICFIKKKRLSGFIIAAVGTIACYLIYKLFVP
ncbi:PepSY-associated TM helix domain-containing protein [Pedobacter punctiformis]|uniref:PepSY-associated TM helix domain-containing protein n=1 Tax=Pedobacter punctiformis TaxID=3004097 RepID=A0ABT4L7P4_9SPHI|nr:PepSY-associated TM helix domain-containing protein [Pedobacter sp. HCMS5-2]MCZ4243851.1 PepSY-associated TM helix domain-containing protein [Pedobacter sp. HCMS5-2]